MRDIPLAAWWILWFFLWELLSPFTFWILILASDWVVRSLCSLPRATTRNRILYGWAGLGLSVLVVWLFNDGESLIKKTHTELYWVSVGSLFVALGISAWRLRGIARLVGVVVGIVLYTSCVYSWSSFSRTASAQMTWRAVQESELWEHDRTVAKKPIALILMSSPQQGKILLADSIAERLIKKGNGPFDARFYLGYEWGYLTSIYVTAVDGMPVTFEQNGTTVGWRVHEKVLFPARWVRLANNGFAY